MTGTFEIAKTQLVRGGDSRWSFQKKEKNDSDLSCIIIVVVKL